MELLPKDAEKRQKNKKTNKRILMVFGPVIAFFLIIGIVGGGSDGSESAPEKAQSDAQAKVAPTTGSNKTEAPKGSDEKFASLVAPDLPAGMTVRQAKNNALNVCRRLDLGHDPKKVRAGVREMHGTKAGDSIYEAAITVYCPKAVK